MTIEDVVRCAMCAHTMLDSMDDVDGDLQVEKVKWIGACRHYFPEATEDQAWDLLVVTQRALIEQEALRCVLWELAHAIDHMLRGDEKTRH